MPPSEREDAMTATDVSGATAQGEVPAGTAPRSSWLALYVLCFGVLMIVLDQSIVNVALPSIRQDLGFTPSSLAWVVNAYLLTYGGVLLLCGRLGDLRGNRRVFLVGTAVFTVSSVACGLATTPTVLVVGRVVQGLGGAAVTAVGLALIMGLFTDPAERAKALGVYGFVLSGGGAIGVLLGGVLTDLLSWHWIFLVNVPIGVGVLVAARSVLPLDDVRARRARLDGLGAVLVTGALMLVVSGIVGGDDAGWGSGRTVALLDGSVRFLDALGAWPAVAPHAAPLAVLQIIDDTGSLFRPPPVRFAAGEIGLDAFGWNVESARLVAALRAVAREAPGLTLVEADAEAVALGADGVRLTLADGGGVAAALAVGADGARSRVREAAGIATRVRDLPQAALTALLAHERPHGDVSTEFHTREGPFTLVPLPGGRRSSLVWLARSARAEDLAALPDAAFAAAAERQAHAMLGRMRVDGPRGRVAMRTLSVARQAGPRSALVGEAAHVFPPIGAQGLNLGLRDAAALRDVLVPAHLAGEDLGARATLDRYARARSLDVRTRAAAVGALNGSLLTDLLPLDLMRGAGLVALSALGPLRRAVMREGVLPGAGAPTLMRAASGHRGA